MQFEVISALRSGWIQTHFASPLIAHASQRGPGRLHWVVADTGWEGDYLIQKVQGSLSEAGLHFSQIKVSPWDPYRIWENTFGTSDEKGIVPEAVNGVIGFVGAHLIPTPFLLERLTLFRSVAQGLGVSFLFPITWHTYNQVQQQLKGDAVVMADEFRVLLKDEQLECIAEDLSLVPGLTDENCRRYAELLHEASPQDRQQVRDWINHYAENSSFEEAVSNDPPPPKKIGRKILHLSYVPTKDELESLLRSTTDKLSGVNALYEQWLGQPLVYKLANDKVPCFTVADPEHWFTACVSCIARRIADGVDRKSFDFLSDYAYDQGRNEIHAGQDRRFRKQIEALRASQQHGLIMKNTQLPDAIRISSDWYHGKCGELQPQREHWRYLTWVLLTEWDRTVSQMLELLEHIPYVTSRASIEAQIRVKQQKLDRAEWLTIIREEMQRLKLDIDTRPVIQLFPKMNKELARSVVRPHRLMDEARKIAAKHVLEALVMCPVTPADIVNLGCKPGISTALVLYSMYGAWETDHSLDREALLTFAQQIIESKKTLVQVANDVEEN